VVIQSISEQNNPEKSRHLVGRSLARPFPATDFEDKTDEAPARRLRIVFIGLSAGAGVSTLASSFAEHLVKEDRRKPSKEGRRLITVLELSDDIKTARGSDYDRIGCDRRFAGRNFSSCHSIAASGRSVRNLINMDSGVNWLLRRPGETSEKLKSEDWLRLIGGVAGDVLICNIDGEFPCANEKLTRRILCDADSVIAVVDPLPSSMMAEPGRLELIKEAESSGIDVRYVINKMNPGVNKRELRSFLRIKNYSMIPYFDPAQIYTAEYNCCTLYAMPKLRETLRIEFTGFMT